MLATNSGAGGVVVLFLPIVAAIAFFWLRKKMHDRGFRLHRNRFDNAVKQYQAWSMLDMGVAATGLAAGNGNPVICLISSDTLRFFPAAVNDRFPGKSKDPLLLIGTIPIPSIIEIVVEDKSNVSLQTRDLMVSARTRQSGCVGCFGSFSSSGRITPTYQTIRKMVTETLFVLRIDWIGDTRYKTSTTFAFDNSDVANEALATLRPLFTSDAEEFDAERYCPFCAEKVKMQAIRCRFCGADLPA